MDGGFARCGGVLRALAETAFEAGVDRMYLQVERDNPAAIALYAAASFRELYGYHYRVLRGAPRSGGRSP
jgi:ribosomal protein S18 acetylase RimI-like enzyme